MTDVKEVKNIMVEEPEPKEVVIPIQESLQKFNELVKFSDNDKSEKQVVSLIDFSLNDRVQHRKLSKKYY